MRIVYLGVIVNEEKYYRTLADGIVPFPVGYMIERPVIEGAIASALSASPAHQTSSLLSTSDPVTFVASIARGDDGPIFCVARSDRPDRIHKSGNISTVWREAIAAAETDFPELREMNIAAAARVGGRGAKRASDATTGTSSRLVVNGLAKFGLMQDGVLSALRALPGGDELWRSRSAAAAKKAAGGHRSGSGDGVAEVVTVEGSQEAPPATRRKRSPPTVNTKVSRDTPPQGRVMPRAASPLDGVPAKSRRTVAPRTSMPLPAPVSCKVCGLSGTPFCAATGKPHDGAASASASASATQTPEVPTFKSSPRAARSIGSSPVTGARTASLKPACRTRPGNSGAQVAATAEGDAENMPLALLVASEAERAHEGPPQKSSAGSRGAASTTTKAKTGHNGAGKAVSGGKAATVAGEQSILSLFLRQQPTLGDVLTSPPQSLTRQPAPNTGKQKAGAADAPAMCTVPEEIESGPREYVYPPPRPPLPYADQMKAKGCIVEFWRAKLEEAGGAPLTAPLVEGIALPGAGLAGRVQRRIPPTTRHRKAPAPNTTTCGGGDNGPQSDEDGNGAEQFDAAERGELGTHVEAHAGGTVGGGVVGSGNAHSAVMPPSLSHPLDISDLTSSYGAGKRFLQFVSAYTSERAKLDLLRRASNAARSTATAVVDADAAAGDGGDVTVSPKPRPQRRKPNAGDASPEADSLGHGSATDRTMESLPIVSD